MKNIIVSITLLTAFCTIYTMEQEQQYLYIQTKDALIKVEKQMLRNSYVLTCVTDLGIGSLENPIKIPFTKERFETQCMSPQAQRTCHTITART